MSALGLLQSARVRGASDHAHAESLFQALKAELTRGAAYSTERALRREFVTYLQYYNTLRLHSSLSYLSPLAYEQRVA